MNRTFAEWLVPPVLVPVFLMLMVGVAAWVRW